MRLICRLAAFAVIAGALAACGGGSSKTPTAVPPTSTFALATPVPVSGTPAAEGTATIPATVELAPADSQFPAASVCSEPPGDDVVTWRIMADIPSPRCNQIRTDQTVAFINDTEETIDVQLGAYKLTITSGFTGEISQPVGTYLAPGVHVAHTSIYGGQSGPEVWVVIPGSTPAP
jgi:hypothetical protein